MWCHNYQNSSRTVVCVNLYCTWHCNTWSLKTDGIVSIRVQSKIWTLNALFDPFEQIKDNKTVFLTKICQRVFRECCNKNPVSTQLLSKTGKTRKRKTNCKRRKKIKVCLGEQYATLPPRTNDETISWIGQLYHTALATISEHLYVIQPST